MCGRFSLNAPAEVLVETFRLTETPDLSPRYNIAPTQQVPVVREEGGSRQLELLRWGLVPFWAKDPAIGSKLINARGDSIHEKPAFRNAFRRQRCLVPTTGFYEWQPTGAGRGRKQPFFIARPDGGVFAFAGLWEKWRDPDGKPLETFTIITTDANGLVSSIHDRMPVVIEPADYDRWLDPEFRDTEALRGLMHAPPDAELVARPVGLEVNNPMHEGPECIAPLEEG